MFLRQLLRMVQAANRLTDLLRTAITVRITEQIAALEADLSQKNAALQEYEKLFDRLLKYHFGLSKKDIEKLITEKEKQAISSPAEWPAHMGVSGDLPVTVIPLEGKASLGGSSAPSRKSKVPRRGLGQICRMRQQPSNLPTLLG